MAKICFTLPEKDASKNNSCLLSTLFVPGVWERTPQPYPGADQRVEREVFVALLPLHHFLVVPGHPQVVPNILVIILQLGLQSLHQALAVLVLVIIRLLDFLLHLGGKLAEPGRLVTLVAEVSVEKVDGQGQQAEGHDHFQCSSHLSCQEKHCLTMTL